MKHLRFVRRLLTSPAAVAAAIATTVAIAGCRTTTPSGSSYVTKVDRELRAYVDAGLAHTHQTARQMLEEEFLFKVIAEGLDGREGFLEAESARGRYVRVETYLVDFNRTEVDVYVTPFGYMPLQVDIMTKLGERLGATPRAKPE